MNINGYFIISKSAEVASASTKVLKSPSISEQSFCFRITLRAGFMYVCIYLCKYIEQDIYVQSNNSLLTKGLQNHAKNGEYCSNADN